MSPAGRSCTVAEALAAFEAGGAEGLLPYLTEDVLWADDPEWPDAQVSHGREAVQAIIEERLDTTSIQLELEGMEERGDRVLAWFRWHAVGEASGATAVLLPAVVFDFSGDLIARVRFFLDREHARAEFGGGGA